MLFIIVRFFLSFAYFRIESPDSLKNLNIPIDVSNFGDASLYSRYGKLVKLEDCLIDIELDHDSIILLPYRNDTCISTCAQLIEYKGGKGLIVIQNSSKIITKDCDTDFPTIFILGITEQTYSDHIKPYDNIWVSYKYDLSENTHPFLHLKLSGNFSQDQHTVQNFLRLNLKFLISWEFVHFTLSISHLADNDEDCLTSDGVTYCKKGSSVPGSEILKIYALILNVYEKLDKSNTVVKYLHLVKTILQNCEDDYNCTMRHSQNLIPGISLDLAVLGRLTIEDSAVSRVTINSIDIYWMHYLESAFCLSFIDPPKHCEQCSTGCSYEFLRSGNCTIWCDNVECGYSNLACLEEYGCYSFMLNDGNCNEVCISDPDCNDDGQYIKFFIYTVLASCIFIFVMFFGASIIALCKESDPNLLENQIKSTCELELRSQQVENIPVRMCPLDMVEIANNDECIITPCDHAFHLSCLQSKLEDGYLKECPCCREDLKDFKIIK